MRSNSKFTKPLIDHYDILKGMTNIQSIFAMIKLRLGDLWWYTAVFFIVQRLGDAINAFIGLWLVPKYVPQEELGALLPLAQVGSVLAFPLSILAVVFIKYVNLFAVRGEYGKVKSLLRDVFCLAAIFFFAVMLYARFFLPLVFERMRVADGRLGMLVVASGVLGIASTFFTNALQALKHFKVLSLSSLIGAPLRLVTLLIVLPIRALSGYFVGQIVPTLYGIGAALFGLRTILFNKRLRAMPYLREDGGSMLRFAWPVLLGSLCGMPQGLVEAFVIRHRLPDLDSAGYYMISRFAEMGAYVGLSMMVVMFPLASEQHEKGKRSHKLILQSMSGALLAGSLLALAFRLWGGPLLNLTPAWRPYAAFAPHLALLTVIIAMRSAINCFMSHEIAHARFGFYWYSGAITMIESLFLYGITGFSFFAPWVPASWIRWVDALNPSRLEFVLGVMLWSTLTVLVCMGAQIVAQRLSRHGELAHRKE
jgi:O-antigen/teichoic acid export membrane protein